MLAGKREKAWEHTSALIASIQAMAGVKNPHYKNPYEFNIEDQDPNQEFRSYLKNKGLRQ